MIKKILIVLGLCSLLTLIAVLGLNEVSKKNSNLLPQSYPVSYSVSYPGSNSLIAICQPELKNSLNQQITDLQAEIVRLNNETHDLAVGCQAKMINCVNNKKTDSEKAQCSTTFGTACIKSYQSPNSANNKVVYQKRAQIADLQKQLVACQ